MNRNLDASAGIERQRPELDQGLLRWRPCLRPAQLARGGAIDAGRHPDAGERAGAQGSAHGGNAIRSLCAAVVPRRLAARDKSRLLGGGGGAEPGRERTGPSRFAREAASRPRPVSRQVAQPSRSPAKAGHYEDRQRSNAELAEHAETCTRIALRSQRALRSSS